MYADNLTDVDHILHGYILSSIHLFDVERIIGRLINMSNNISNMLLILSKCYVNMDIFYYYHYNIYLCILKE